MRLILSIFSFLICLSSFAFDKEDIALNNISPSVNWLNGSSRWFFHNPVKDGQREFYLVDTRTWKKHKMFDNQEFADKLNSLSEKGGITPENIYLGIPEFDRKDVFKFTFSCKGEHFSYDIRRKKLSKIEKPENRKWRKPSGDWYKSWSKDSTFYMTAKGHDLWLFNAETGDSTCLADDGEQYWSWCVSGKREIQDGQKGGAIGKWIGNSGKRLMIREDWRSVGTLTLVNSLSEPRPTAKTYKFAMPGDTGVVRYDVMLADAVKGELKRVDMDRFKDQKIRLPILKQFPHTDRYAYLIRLSRTCDTLDLCRIDVGDGSVKTLISEVCKPHFNDQLFNYHIINDGSEILWWSERTGKGRWYLYDGEGNLKNQLTGEDFVSAEIVRIDTLERKVVFEGFGKEKDINPHYRFFYEADMDGRSPAKLLTPGNGTHSISFSPDGRFITDSYSRMDMAHKHQIVDRQGTICMEMEGTDVSELEAKGWRYPDVVKVKAADGMTDLYGVVYTPLEMQKGKKYPIISCVYPGPQDDQVPQAFFLDENDNQSLADRGFVVINFAYRGSGPYRGRDFHSYGYGNLRDYPLDDDHAVIRQIAQIYPCADSTRVGIFGHSGGGFMTVAAMLERPDFYKVGVSASGNHDNNIYMQQWAETFHGVQNQGGCFCCKVPTNMEKAGNLKGKLMLITGDMDNNVHPACTYRLVNALIKKNKRFDMMVFPGVDHGIGGDYYVNLVHDYFTEHLK